jgi:hypothetical protein
MCSGDRLVADFIAGTDAWPGLPEELDEHLTTTVNGQWVVWAHKLARQKGDLFVPLTGGPGYPADARAECRFQGVRSAHDVPDPGCTCGFHALSSRRFPGLPAGRRFTALTVALSGRVLAFEWAGGGVLWRAERQTVVRIDRPAPFDRTAGLPVRRRHPDDPDGRLAIVPAATPRDSGPVRLNLPVSCPVLPVCHDDAGWCAGIQHVRALAGISGSDLARAVPAGGHSRCRAVITLRHNRWLQLPCEIRRSARGLQGEGVTHVGRRSGIIVRLCWADRS